MRVAHLLVITPGRCGLHETARDLAAGLRGLGIDSRLVDPDPVTNPVFKGGVGMPAYDRRVPVADIGWALEADIIVSHSGHEVAAFADSKQPIIHVAHGRPLSTYLGERSGGTPIYSAHARFDADPRVRAVVTFWPQHVDYHRVMFRQTPIYHVQAAVDLAWWCPEGWRDPADKTPQVSHTIATFETPADPFRGHGGWFNAVITDGWRDDIDPFNALNAWALWARAHPGAKIHLYGKPQPAKGTDAILQTMLEDGVVGNYRGWRPQEELRDVYRAADCLITPHEIDTRAVREAMACGCPVVRVRNDLAFEAPTCSREEVRRLAERLFDSRRSAVQFRAILETVLR